jgi:hypothetical protein
VKQFISKEKETIMALDRKNSLDLKQLDLFKNKHINYAYTNCNAKSDLYVLNWDGKDHHHDQQYYNIKKCYSDGL